MSQFFTCRTPTENSVRGEEFSLEENWLELAAKSPTLQCRPKQTLDRRVKIDQALGFGKLGFVEKYSVRANNTLVRR